MTVSTFISRARRFTAAAAVAALAVGLASCASSDSGTAAACDGDTAINGIFGEGGEAGGQGVTVKVGMLLAMTGSGSSYGEVMSNGAKLAAEQILAACGPDFEIAIGDHESGSVPAAVAAARKLISQDGINVLQTSFGGVSEAIIPLVQQNKILTLQGGGTSPGQIGKDYLWNTRQLFADPSIPGGLAWVAQTYPEATKMAVVGTLENGINAQTKLIPEIWPEVAPGGTVVLNEQHEVGLTDFGQIIAKIQSAEPDVIWIFEQGGDNATFMKALRRAGVTAPVVSSETGGEEVCKLAPEEFDTVIALGENYDVANPNPFNEQFVTEYKDAYGKNPDIFAANYYEEMFVFWELVNRVVADGGDPTSGEQLQAALAADPTFQSVYGGSADEVGTMSIDEETHLPVKPMGAYTIKDCQLTQVATITEVDEGGDPFSGVSK
ncbi:ABC transporter substrate-binding protein [Herbiconiux sp.]|uniref:ABC transporter substrate-binding protein n=1 Tax=Herbiconiux sp. TaxID=1871186 RepID=UPI0025BC1CB4|nr:ABC transporter substrate-binding protein [Herbiconiux sp.]